MGLTFLQCQHTVLDSSALLLWNYPHFALVYLGSIRWRPEEKGFLGLAVQLSGERRSVLNVDAVVSSR